LGNAPLQDDISITGIRRILMDNYRAAISRLFEPGDFPEDAFHIQKAFEGRKIIIYGAGECCHWFVEVVMRIHGYLPVAVLDRAFKRGETFEGIPAFSPLDYHPTDEEKRDAIVVICVCKPEYRDEITRCLKELGFQRIISLMDVYEIHNPFSLPVELQEKGFDFYQERKGPIFDCLELFADDMSREVYARCLQTHMQRKPVPLPDRPRKEQYFPRDIQLSCGYSRTIFCGSDTGDTMELLRNTCGKVDALVCFEPDPFLFDQLPDYFWKHSSLLASYVIAMPCAVYSRNSIMRFTSANYKQDRTVPTGFGSRIMAGGALEAQCVKLDDALPGFNPTFIGIDIEGAELEALKGADKTIRTSRPDLGICVYHAPSHLWEIPLFLHSMGLGYRFYLRNYTSFTSETVLYATV
jgi:FkbM family methyltransferase